MNRRRIELEDKAKDSVPKSDATTFALSSTVIQSFFYGLMKIKSPETIIQYMYIQQLTRSSLRDISRNMQIGTIMYRLKDHLCAVHKAPLVMLKDRFCVIHKAILVMLKGHFSVRPCLFTEIVNIVSPSIHYRTKQQYYFVLVFVGYFWRHIGHLNVVSINHQWSSC